MSYNHIEINSIQTPKRIGEPCGDVIEIKRSVYHTTIILVDGIGSGVKANIAATMNAARLSQLLDDDFSPRDAFSALVKTMNRWRDYNEPFSAITLLRILNDGSATALCYENPSPLFIGKRNAQILHSTSLTFDESIVTETNYHLRLDEGILMVSDGITQAGIGNGLPAGWTNDGLCKYINTMLAQTRSTNNLCSLIHSNALKLDKNTYCDDMTVVFAQSTKGNIVNLFTGPPSNRCDDKKVAFEFLSMDGLKIICGGSTADIIARYLNKKINMENPAYNMNFTPPNYSIEGIDIVSEGAITLNQLYNILDEDLLNSKERSVIFDLWYHILWADRINFFVGKAFNQASDDILWKKQGILPRLKILPLLIKKLESLGKLLSVKYY